MSKGPLSYPVRGANGDVLVTVSTFREGVWSEFGRLHVSMTPTEARHYAAALDSAAHVAEELAKEGKST